jgi:hypothetical protein
LLIEHLKFYNKFLQIFFISKTIIFIIYGLIAVARLQPAMMSYTSLPASKQVLVKAASLKVAIKAEL